MSTDLREKPEPRRTETSDEPNVRSTQTNRDSGPRVPLPKRIGYYKILEVLGEGGMGVVYLAEQTEPVRRRVALKVIKLGMDTKHVIARFESERQALALMNHPGVAKVTDAGTTEQGRPFFAMEYVPGVPITEHCDRYKLNIEERLHLFMQLCDAVQHAHQKGVIHRDIKPKNVLVSVKEGQVVAKVIDFGVAKAISQPLIDKTLFTGQGQLIGTPAYMSPEQAEMTARDIDTRTDIYSLGMLLYELLTGELPLDPKSLREVAFEHILRMIREFEPPNPSTKLSGIIAVGDDTSTATARNRRTNPRMLTSQLRGDLDWITMKALEKDRSRRYATASALAEDIERHLGHVPVLAGPPTAAYRLRKFVRRNRGSVTAAAVVFLVLVAGVAGTTWQAVVATRQRDRAVAAEGLAVVINLAGKQRMLTQKMSKEFLLVYLGIDAQENRMNLHGTASLFDRTLHGLLDGDADLELPGTEQPEIRRQLQLVLDLWKEFYPLTSKASDPDAKLSPSTAARIAKANLPLLREMNEAVKMYEELAKKPGTSNASARSTSMSTGTSTSPILEASKALSPASE